jgi:serine/threonine protein kinase
LVACGSSTLFSVVSIGHAASGAVGFLVIAFDADSELTQVLGSSCTGSTGETIAVNEGGRLISKSRFGSGSKSLNLLSKSPAGSTKEKESSNDFELRNTLDQRGVETVYVSCWMPSLGIGLVTKMDRAEAYAPIIQIRRFMWVLCGLLALTTVAAGVYRWNIYRLEKLAKQSDLDRKMLGAYELEKKVGEGGMGVVYQAKHALMRRPTAIKILPPEKSSPAAIERFEREVRYTSQLKHPNTISIFDYGRTNNGLFYYAMELLDGLNLEQLVQREGQIPDGRVLLILRQVCESLLEAHAMGLIHRDIKPANIMLCDRGGAVDTVKVLDFGMVRDRSWRSSRLNNTLSGTPAYMAPECFADPAGVDVRVDVFAVGAVGFFLLTGAPLLDADSLNALQRILKTDLGKSAFDRIQVTARDSNRAISDGLCRLISRCVAADREHRCASVAEVLKEISDCQPRSVWDRDNARIWWQKAANIMSHEKKSDDTAPEAFSGSHCGLDETQAFINADEVAAPSSKQID